MASMQKKSPISVPGSETVQQYLPANDDVGCSGSASYNIPNNRAKPFLRRNLSYVQNLATPIEESKPRGEILYHFHQMIPNPKAVDGVSVKTLYRKNLKCPLCPFKADDVQGIWMHLTTSNFNFEFSALKDAEGMLHIAADSSKKSTSRQRRLEATTKSQAIYSHESEIIFCRSTNEFCRYFPYKSEPLRTHAPEPFLEDVLETNELQAPVRDYRHPVSGNKISMGEWMLLKRIVTPSDTTWQKRIMYAMIDDFDDVSTAEKHFFKLWNDFVKPPTFIQDIKQLCKRFVESHFPQITSFEEQYISLVENLWEEHQITRKDIVEIMQHYNGTIMKARKLNEGITTAASTPAVASA